MDEVVEVYVSVRFRVAKHAARLTVATATQYVDEALNGHWNFDSVRRLVEWLNPGAVPTALIEVAGASKP